MKLFIYILIIFNICSAYANNCDQVPTFIPDTKIELTIEVEKIYWTNQQEQKFEKICSASMSIPSYDVRGREDDAFRCLIPQENAMLICNTVLDGNNGQIAIVPATWIRDWHQTSKREYRFHAYAFKNDSNYLKDIYSRALIDNLILQNITIDGALKTGLDNPDDGFFIRVDFHGKNAR